MNHEMDRTWIGSHTVGQKYFNNRYRKLEDGDLNNVTHAQWLSDRQYQPKLDCVQKTGTE